MSEGPITHETVSADGDVWIRCNGALIATVTNKKFDPDLKKEWAEMICEELNRQFCRLGICDRTHAQMMKGQGRD